MEEDTVVLEKNYVANAKAGHAGQFSTDSAPVIGGKLSCKGISFRWWSVGHGPYRVIVHNSTFGSRSQYTADDVEAFAMQLAESLLASEKSPE